MRLLTVTLLACSMLQPVLSVGVSGKPVGYASGTTGGGNANPQAPSNAAQLKAWLEDDVPRVIVLDKEYNFKGAEGICNKCPGCKPTSYTCGSKGQLAIDLPGQTWCDSLPYAQVSYDKAAVSPIQVKSNKSLVGVGSKGVIRGKGLRVANGVRNVIIQNIHITELNPQYIWGGDAITLTGSDLVWIDHVKISLIGRQMLVTGYDSAGRVTVSNCEFDGLTNWSASCDGRHYWAILGYGKNDMITFTGNYVHHTSGRSPKIEGNNIWHAVNNYWQSNSGHAFDVGQNSQALIEGNVFETVARVIQDNKGQVFLPTASTAVQCNQFLKRNCQANIFDGSPSVSGNQNGFLVNMKGYDVAPANVASLVKSDVLTNAGVGKI